MAVLQVRSQCQCLEAVSVRSCQPGARNAEKKIVQVGSAFDDLLNERRIELGGTQGRKHISPALGQSDGALDTTGWQSTLGTLK